MSYTYKINLANRNNYGNIRDLSKIKYIVIHYTANDGDSDESNGKYFHNNVIKASAHYFVDSDSVTQSVPDNYVAYSVGGSKYSSCETTGGGKYYKICTNANSISIELCDDKKDGVIRPSVNTINNAIELTSKLMSQYNIPIDNVIRHFDVVGKLCPAYWCGNKTNDELWLKEFKNNIGTSNGVQQSVDTTLIDKGMEYAKKFIEGNTNKITKSNVKAMVLQTALNKDYGSKIIVDGKIGEKTKEALGSHYVKKGEKQYMVTAAEILMYLNNFNPNGVEIPGEYGNGLASVAKIKFGGNGTKITSDNFISLL